MIDCAFCLVKCKKTEVKDGSLCNLENLCKECMKLHLNYHIKKTNNIEYMFKEWDKGKLIRTKGNNTELL